MGVDANVILSLAFGRRKAGGHGGQSDGDAKRQAHDVSRSADRSIRERRVRFLPFFLAELVADGK